MAFAKYLVSALSVATSAYAASCSTTATATLQNGGDVSSLGSCTTYSGSISIATGVSNAGTVDLGAVEEITGNLIFTGPDDAVKTFQANSLKSVGSINLTQLTQVGTINMQQLTEIGDLTIQNLGSLSTLNLGTGLQKAATITIIDTLLQDVSGVTGATELDSLVISDNNFLSNVTIDLESINSTDIGPNNVVNGLNLIFPNLLTADTLTFRNATNIQTPSLMNVTGILGLYGNTLQSYAAPNLTWAGAVVVNDNSQLSNLSFPKLASINSTEQAALQVANNTQLKKIDGFDQLGLVNGNVDFSGNIDEITLKSIKKIVGALTVDTSSDSFDCDAITNLQSSQVVLGSATCKDNDPNPSGTSGGSGGSGTGSGSAESSSGAAVPLDMPAWTTGAGLLGGLFALLL